MAITINAAAQDLGGDAIAQTLPAGTLRLYSGASAPADAKGAEGTAIAEGTTAAFGAHAGNAGAGMSAATALTGLAAAGAGTVATHFRFIGSGGVVVQGSVTGTGGGGDLVVDNVNVAESQTVTVNTFVFTMPAE